MQDKRKVFNLDLKLFTSPIDLRSKFMPNSTDNEQ